MKEVWKNIQEKVPKLAQVGIICVLIALIVLFAMVFGIIPLEPYIDSATSGLAYIGLILTMYAFFKEKLRQNIKKVFKWGGIGIALYTAFLITEILLFPEKPISEHLNMSLWHTEIMFIMVLLFIPGFAGIMSNNAKEAKDMLRNIKIGYVIVFFISWVSVSFLLPVGLLKAAYISIFVSLLFVMLTGIISIYIKMIVNIAKGAQRIETEKQVNVPS